MHLGHGDKSVPVRDGSETGPGMKVHAGKTEGRGNQRAGLASIRSKAFTVLVELGVEAAGSTAGPYFFHRRHIDAEQIGEGL